MPRPLHAAVQGDQVEPLLPPLVRLPWHVLRLAVELLHRVREVRRCAVSKDGPGVPEAAQGVQASSAGDPGRQEERIGVGVGVGVGGGVGERVGGGGFRQRQREWERRRFECECGLGGVVGQRRRLRELAEKIGARTFKLNGV